MSAQRPLVLVDDDKEDQELLLLVLRELGFDHEIKLFNTAEAALNFLYESGDRPFMIVSDINMPRMDGITFKKKIESCKILQPRHIPFVFLSTSAKFVAQTGGLNIQGYFQKGNSWQELRETVEVILRYWQRTQHTASN
ncbi:response regulator [Fulvivirgaceae bacterium PWU4]|uniref:Response regulator n=1 Tax=Chryseosolibacter histidini TaxID=2782349 RepID=A0AAP2DMB2_9BACT|nr:response regulator [Chryseosolibacter histidini]MBT1696644.1 response regulator [Chryseosolibacter histidini]